MSQAKNNKTNFSPEDKKRDNFRQILVKLAKDQVLLNDSTELNDICKEFENLYHSSEKEVDFRHFYSDIFSVLTIIKNKPSLGDINVLGQNLDVIRKNYSPTRISEAKEKIDISKNLQKLYDHVNLDIARLNYNETEFFKHTGEDKIKELQAQINEAKEKLATTEKFQEELQNKVNKNQTDYIAILGIFSAVVLAFTAGIGFSTSVLSNIDKASIYRIITVILIVGIVLANILYALFAYLERIIKRRHKINVKFLVKLNVFFFILLTIIFLCWAFGVDELRDEFVQWFQNKILN